MFSENQAFSPFGWSDPTFLGAGSREEREEKSDKAEKPEKPEKSDDRWVFHGFSGRILMITCEWGLDHETWPLVGV